MAVSPNLYRPTFLPTTPTANDATHDYLQIKTVDEAERLAELHRFHEQRKDRISLPRKRGPALPLRCIS